jgi:hypothetical protein
VPAPLRRIGPPVALRHLQGQYEDSYLPTGYPVGTCEEALDTACGLYLNDPTAWTPPPAN